MNRKQKISQSFGRRAVYYSQEATLQKTVAKNLANFLPALHQADILEIGCGTGFLTTRLIKSYPDCHLLVSDLSENMVSFTKENSPHHPSIDFKILDGEKLGKGLPNQFDLIITSMTLQWFTAPGETLKKLQHFLKPGGILLYSTLAPDCFPEWRQTLKDLSYPCGLITVDPLPGEISHDTFCVSHKSALEFFRQLKNLGTSTPDPIYNSLTPGQFRKALEHINQHYNAQMSWHITYGQLPFLTQAESLEQAGFPLTTAS